MSNRYSDRVLALAGLAQALHQVRRIAETGQSEGAAVQSALEYRHDGAPLRLLEISGDGDTPAGSDNTDPHRP